MRKICMLLALLTLLLLPQAQAEGTAYFPHGTTHIEQEAFYNCLSLEKAVLPATVTHIGPRAFGRSSLREITLPASVTSIADDAFSGCPEGLTILADEGTYAWRWAMSHGYFELHELVIELPLSAVKQIDISETFQIPYHTVPANAAADLTWMSHDPEILTVDKNGLVTPLKAGYGYITVLSDGSYVAGLSLEVVGSPYSSDGLMFEPTADGSGYRVVDCTGNPERITIPATFNSKPVTGFEPGAFKDCTILTDIALESGHTVLYMEKNALYTNSPHKTLLCYPGSHDLMGNFYIPAGTKAIAPYAFANCKLDIITVPGGLTTIGDYAFYRNIYQLGVYLPDSVTSFGKSLFQGQQSNAYFYVTSWESPGAIYAQENNIPVGTIDERTPEPTAAPTPTPAPTPVPSVPPVDESKIVIFDQLDRINVQHNTIECTYDISQLEGDSVSEVRMDLRDQWKDLQYVSGRAQQTGLYGAGYTAKEAVLRAYDRNGVQIGMQIINGDFAFSFDGARMLGVSGGKNTRMTVIPTKPIFVSTPGRYPIRHSEWHQLEDGNIYQHYILKMPRGMASMDFPHYLNIMAPNPYYAITGNHTSSSQSYESGYCYVTCQTYDSSRADQIDVITLVFDSMELLLKNDDFSCYAASLPDKTEYLGEDIYNVYLQTRSEMLKGHYPTQQAIAPVQVRLNGGYPTSWQSIVELDQAFFEYDEWDVSILSHELTHAIDQGMKNCDYLPSPWMEGRAELISMAVTARMDAPYTSSTYPAGTQYNWSFMSEADRADFFTYYTTSSNRTTEYVLGYYFYRFLMDTYGSNVGARIMQNVATASFNPETANAVFKQCVEAATEKGVFQRFIDDVVTPSGT
ncbi:MAG: hypothetical protein E7318_06550 [Clostridiales bacterium]|nr:hypothetical protein [Clostridiales bacterium]